MMAITTQANRSQRLAALRVPTLVVHGTADRMVHSSGEGWVPPVLTCSGLEGTDVDTVWDKVLDHRSFLGEEGLASKRAEQQLDFTWALLRDELDQRLRRSPGVRAIREDVRRQLLAGELTAPLAADRLIAAYDED